MLRMLDPGAHLSFVGAEAFDGVELAAGFHEAVVGLFGASKAAFVEDDDWPFFL